MNYMPEIIKYTLLEVTLDGEDSQEPFYTM